MERLPRSWEAFQILALDSVASSYLSHCTHAFFPLQFRAVAKKSFRKFILATTPGSTGLKKIEPQRRHPSVEKQNVAGLTCEGGHRQHENARERRELGARGNRIQES